MEFLGIIAFGFAMFNSDKIDRLKKEIAKLKKENKGELSMSLLLKSIIGQPCTLQRSSGVAVNVREVLDVDEEWIKYIDVDKKGEQTKIERLDLFCGVTLQN